MFRFVFGTIKMHYCVMLDVLYTPLLSFFTSNMQKKKKKKNLVKIMKIW